MSEIISINLGQAGVQIGESFWEHFKKQGNLSNYQTLFKENKLNQMVSRCIFVDSHNEDINALKSSANSHLFHHQNLISSVLDSRNIYLRADSKLGQALAMKAAEKIRQESEACDNLQGFLITHSIGGGTGSGLNSLILEELSDHYDNKAKLNFTVFPFYKISPIIVEPYNVILGLNKIIELSDACFVLNNSKIFEIAQQKLGIARPVYKTLNNYIACLISSVIGPAVNGGSLNVNLNEIVDNLVVNKDFKYLDTKISPVLNTDYGPMENLSVSEIVERLFDPVIKVDREKSETFFASCLMFKGNVVPQDIKMAGIKVNKMINFGKLGLGQGISGFDETKLMDNGLGFSDKNGYLIKNSTDVCIGFSDICEKFNKLYDKKAYVHWFHNSCLTENMFDEARERVQCLIQEYKDSII